MRSDYRRKQMRNMLRAALTPTLCILLGAFAFGWWGVVGATLLFTFFVFLRMSAHLLLAIAECLTPPRALMRTLSLQKTNSLDTHARSRTRTAASLRPIEKNSTRRISRVRRRRESICSKPLSDLN